MNTKLIVALAIAAALVAGLLLADKDAGQTFEDSPIETEAPPTGSASDGSTAPSRFPVEIPALKNAEDAVEPPRWPDAVESLIYDHLSQLEGFEFTNIASVGCGAHTCEIVFSGQNPNPTIIDGYSDVMNGLFRPPISAQKGSMGTREIAPGARQFVIEISNVLHVEPTVNP